MPAGHKRVAPGFTLLELMVAMTLVGLLSLVAFTAMNLTLKAMQRGQATAADLQELRVGLGFLERSLSSATAGVARVQDYFWGESQQMRFFTFLPLEAHNLGGIYHWRVLVGREEAPGGVLAVEQCKIVNWSRDPEGVEIRQILVRHLASCRFFYGKDGKEYDNWDGKRQGGLPQWVRVQAALGNQEPQDWVIPINVRKVDSGTQPAAPQ